MLEGRVDVRRGSPVGSPRGCAIAGRCTVAPEGFVCFADSGRETVRASHGCSWRCSHIGASLLVFGILTGFVGLNVAVVVGSIDALGQPREAWARAGVRRSRWIWQAFGVFFFPAALVYSGMYYFRIRPRVVAATSDIAVERRPIRVPSLPVVPADSDPQVERLAIRLSWVVAATGALAPVAGYAIGFALVGASTGFAQLPPWELLAVYGCVVVIVVAVSIAAFGVTLTPNDLVMRGIVRRRVPWSEVVAITEERKFGTRYVRLWTRSGRNRRLRAPFAQFGVGHRRFESDFAMLERWWMRNTPGTT